MTRALGYFQYAIKSKRPIKIQFSNRLINDGYSEQTIDSVILHELTHWYMYINEKPFDDSDREFKAQAIKVGASLTGTIPNFGVRYGIKFDCCNHLMGYYPEKQAIRYSNGNYHSSCCKSGIILDKHPIKIEDKFKRPRATEQWIEDVITKYSISNKPVINIKVSKPGEIKDIANVANIEKTASGKNKYPGMTFAQLSQLKKISNAQMIPSIKMAIDNNNIMDINKFKQNYPTIYNSSLKYLGKGYTTKLNKLIG